LQWRFESEMSKTGELVKRKDIELKEIQS
jgi:hypothetical protein